MEYPEELYRTINHIVNRSEKIGIPVDIIDLQDAIEYGYRLGLEKGWQYQQESDNASRQWENDSE